MATPKIVEMSVRNLSQKKQPKLILDRYTTYPNTFQPFIFPRPWQQ
jgi:hypothetical protein